MAVGTSGRTYNVGDVKPWVQTAANYLGNLFGFTTIGGWRAHGSVPNSDHPKGLALDFMTNNSSQANELLQYGIAHASELGITYLIYNRKIYEAKNNFQARDYTGPSPHTDHVHISFQDTNPTGIVLGTGTGTTPVGWTDPSSWPVIGQVEGLATKLTDRGWWLRLGYYMLGAGLVLGGILIMFLGPAVKTGEAVVTKGGSLKNE